MYQYYLLLYYFSLILYYELSISMWTSWYSKTNILSTYFVFILCFIWELRLFLISTNLQLIFFFINLYDINKRKFFVIMPFIDNYVLLAVISNSHSLFKTIQFKKYAVNMQEPFNINVK